MGKIAGYILLSSLLVFRSGDVFALNEVVADLWLDIDSTYCDSEPMELCIGGDSNCYSIPGVCPTIGRFHLGDNNPLSGNAQTDDHPFVKHPDDWDYVYIKNASNSGFRLREITLTLEFPGYDQIMVDWASSNIAGRWFPVGKHILMSDWIKHQRQREVWTIYCGNDLACLNKMNLLGSEEFSKEFESQIPWSVREQTYDLGQAGMIKYRPWERPASNESGCDEAFTYYSSQFTNNIHYSCKYDNNKCSYFRYWRSNGHHMKIRLGQMANADRLYRLEFSEAGIGACQMRTGINGVYPCIPGGNDSTEDVLTPSQLRALACGNVNQAADSYTPKIGDYFIRVRNNGNIHVMTLLGEYEYDAINNQLNVPVIHKRGDIVRAEVVPHNLNQMVAGSCDYEFANFYIGEVDHEIDPDGDGPRTSGAQRPENGSNYGFRISLIPLL